MPGNSVNSKTVKFTTFAIKISRKQNQFNLDKKFIDYLDLHDLYD